MNKRTFKTRSDNSVATFLNGMLLVRRVFHTSDEAGRYIQRLISHGYTESK